MRISICSSIANVICRFSAVAVDMLRNFGAPSYLWHQPCAVQPTPGSNSSRHLGLLTVLGSTGINPTTTSSAKSPGKRFESVIERMFEATAGRPCSLIQATGISGSNS